MWFVQIIQALSYVLCPVRFISTICLIGTPGINVLPDCQWSNPSRQTPLIVFIITFGKLGLKLNQLWPGDIMWRQASWPSVVEVISCRLFGASNYLNQCWLVVILTFRNKFPGNLSEIVLLRKRILKCRLKWGPFCVSLNAWKLLSSTYDYSSQKKNADYIKSLRPSDGNMQQ